MEKNNNTNNTGKLVKQTTVTQKKVKVHGVEKFINATTGEIIDMQVNQIEERDFNFTKVWMRNFISTLELVGNKKTAVAFWVIDHLDKENRLIYTNRRMSDEIGVALSTITTTMKILQDADFLRKQSNGVYIVNPDIIFKGSHNARLAILNDYRSIDYVEPEFTNEEKISMLEDSISELQKQLIELRKESTQTVEVDQQLSFDKDGNIFQEARDV